ncbi:hypothetical protein RDn1_318 [Candidatus Termititenax dinenymphae]|uniref:Uncharacterized protein n=2 Tax=Candidatus Termititenax TaxID=2507545 RepID=A0A388TK52_9BACT|nr:hypothetical protein NO1_0198 [Candidatus Termititenax aidoneus]GBR77659.1 hypothetical protein RDn1_318 [Candidatus Termititenax dinenymphae]
MHVFNINNITMFKMVVVLALLSSIVLMYFYINRCKVDLRATAKIMGNNIVLNIKNKSNRSYVGLILRNTFIINEKQGIIIVNDLVNDNDKVMLYNYYYEPVLFNTQTNKAVYINIPLDEWKDRLNNPKNTVYVNYMCYRLINEIINC